MISENAMFAGDEDDQEAEHDRVLVGELVPVLRQERPDHAREVRRKQEREGHRAEAEQPANRPLHEAQHEHAEQEQQEEQIEPVEVEDGFPDVHAVSSGVTGAARMKGRHDRRSEA
jgi:hypothetical protein